MKKYASLFLASALVTSLIAHPGAADASEPNENENEQAQHSQEEFIQASGEITKIVKESNGKYFASVKTESEEFGFYYNNQTPIFDNTGKKIGLTEGMNITLYMDASKSMIMIYPPRYSPEAVMVQTENPGTVQLQKFDADFLNEKGDLVINITNETIITDLLGDTVGKEEIINKNVLIFYEFVLESYSAQTGPTKILLLEKQSNDVEQARHLAKQHAIQVRETSMIPLRLVAEKLGFKVESTGKGALLTKGSASFAITRGSERYNFNKAIGQFSEKPVLLNGKTYVPADFLEKLIEFEN